MKSAGRRGGTRGAGTRTTIAAACASLSILNVGAIAACGHDGHDESRAAAIDEGATRTAPVARTVLERVRATFPAAGRELGLDAGGDVARVSTSKRAVVDVAASTMQPTWVTDAESGVTVAFRLHTARDVSASVEGSVRVLARALEGGDLLHVVRADGVEDLVAFDTRPAIEALTYDVDVSRVAGLRLVGGELEMLDAAGTPRLRVAPPYAVDARGARIEAALEVAGCAVDGDPRDPWGRAVVAPGAASCQVRVRWADATYPLLVDPAWTTTGALAQKRRLHAAVMLRSGRALTMGGTAISSDVASTPIASAEIYDPATATWAATAPLPAARVGHTATTLADGRVIVAGGEMVTGSEQAASDTTTYYDPASAKWSAGPTMVMPMSGHKAVLLPNGKLLLAMGRSPQELDPAGAGAWSATPQLPIPNVEYEMITSPASIGKVLVSGGYIFGAIGNIYQTSYAVYDVTARTWTRGANEMKAARARHSAVLLPNGNALVAGGVNGGTAPVNSAEIYDWKSDSWASTGTMTTGRFYASAILLGNGFPLFAGGASPATEIYVPADGTWVTAGDMSSGRFNFPLLALPSGQAFAIAGDAGGQALASADVFGTAAGKGCVADGQCLSGHCADGVCCNAACDGSCVACSAAAKGAGVDGTCEPIAKGRDPHAKCAATKAETCGASGMGCDGAGQCLRYGAETECRARSCAAGAETRSTCDGAGACQTHGSGCGAYVCAGDACKATCSGDADCATGYVCDTAAHACVSTTRCASDHEQQNPDGSTTDCGAYRCAGVSCATQCASVDECRGGYVCDKDGHCVVPAATGATASDEGGCACAVTGGGARHGEIPWPVIPGAALVLTRARRRRRAP